MSGRYLPQRPEPSSSAVLVGNPVSSMYQWMQMGALGNWLNGCGAQVIPAVCIDRAIPSGATRNLRFRAKTRERTIEYLWCFLLRSVDPGAIVTINTGGTEGTQTYSINSGRDTRLPIIHKSTVAATSNAVTEFLATIVSVTGIIDIDSLSCTELARPSLLQTSVEGGTDTNTLRPREKIAEGGGSGGESTVGVVTAMYGDYRKSGIYHWCVPAEDPITRAAAYTNLLTLAEPVLTSLLTSGATTATVWWSVYAKVDTKTGNVRVTTTQSGVSDSVLIGSTVYAWSTPRAILIDCEDMTASDGRRATSWDDFMIEVQGNGGGTLSLATVSVWNEDI